MPIPTYTPGYPPDGSSLGQTKSVIRNNLDGTFDTVAVDHINNNGQPGSQPAGYHTIIHEVSQTSVSTVTGYNQLFSGVPGTLVVNGVTTPTIPPGGDQQLYSLTGGGVLSQITGSSRAARGYVWVGGLLFQWGTVNFPSANAVRATVLFTTGGGVNFPNNVFNMSATLICKAGGSSTDMNCISIVNGTISTTAFQYQYAGQTAGEFNNFFWLAIGN
jgi:hypothetical protein